MVVNIFFLDHEKGGSDASKEIITAFEGKGFVGGRKDEDLSISFIRQGDVYYLNGYPVSFFEAMHEIKGWLIKADLCFTIGADKANHFLRHQFYYSYLNPYDHEWSKGEVRIYDYLDLLAFCTYVGEYVPSLPISPLGELSPDYRKMTRENGFNDDVFGFLGWSAYKMAEGEIWRSMRRLKEKRKSLIPQVPCMYLSRRYHEIDIEPVAVMPIVWSSNYKNRCLIFIPSRGVTNISEAVEYLENMHEDIAKHTAHQELGVSYVDIVKSNYVLPISSINPAIAKSHTWHLNRTKAAISARSYINALRNIEDFAEKKLFSRERNSILYGVKSIRKVNARSNKIRQEIAPAGVWSRDRKNRFIGYIREDKVAEIPRLYEFKRRNPGIIPEDVCVQLLAEE